PTASPAAASPVSEAKPAVPSSSNNPSRNSSQDNVGTTRRGGKLVRVFRDPPTLDPHLTTDTASANFIVEIFGGLVTIDRDLQIVPDLAENWDVSSDGRVYTFHIRPDARFHSGRPVTAKDVQWSLERAADPATQSPIASQYLGDIVGVNDKLAGTADSIKGVRVIDDRSVEITIDAPKSYFLAKLSYPTGFVLDRETVEADPDNWLRHPNGTGPFKLEEYVIGETIRLTRNDAYHLGPPYLDEVEFILSGGDSMLMYENDEVHLTGVGLADLDRVQDPNSPLNAELHRAPPSFRVDYIGLNVEQPPFDDPKLRQALNLAFDRKIIASSVLQGVVVPAKGIVPPGFPGFNPDLPDFQYDPELARQLLSESRYGQNLGQLPPITLSIAGGFGAALSLDLEVILQSWEELGFPVVIQQTEWATFLQDLHAGRYNMFYSGWIADYPDPENFLDVLFHSESENNHTNYHNAKVDTLLERARVEPDRGARFRMYNLAERVILKDAPWVTLWNRGEGYALIKPNVRDYHLAPIVIPKLRYVYFQE
ncbi:MAG: ABC transporter substrate-binding protein, partial [Dehalococcoidia bacterium]